MNGRKLNIIITVDPEIPVPPLYYGGIERIVHMLICGLVEKGHNVCLFAHADSRVPAKVIPWQGKTSSSVRDSVVNAWQLSNYLHGIKSADVVHSFSRLAYLFLVLRSRLVKIQSYQRHITARSIHLGSILSSGSLGFCACSRYLAAGIDFRGSRFSVIPNGVAIDAYTFIPAVRDDAPLVYLGRIERIKGVHTAVAMALKTGRRLIIAGNYAKGTAHEEYFKKEILPYCDSGQISYVGEADDKLKGALLGRAAALLLPIEWDEPFGIVMVEALACGTPVIAFNRGAVPEIVRDKQTGFICDSNSEMIEALGDLHSIKRSECRRDAEERFSDKVIVGKYEELYYSLLTQ